MKCPNCNEDLQNNMKFCTKCGINIAEFKKEQEKKLEEEKNKIRNEELKKESENKDKDEKVELEKETKTKTVNDKNDKKADDKTKEENNKKSKQKDTIKDNKVKENVNKNNKDNEESKNSKSNKIDDTKKEEKTKKKSNKKKIIALIIIILLLAGAGFGAWWYLSNKEDSNESDKVSLEWGDLYLEVLNDTDKLEDMENQKIQLCDLDKDSIPELIIYGIKNATEYVANIYKINDENKVDTIRVSLDNEFDLKLFYDGNKDDYVWYAVSTNKDETKYYNLNIENGEYNSEEVKLVIGTDSVEIKDNYSQKVDFDKNASEDEKKDVLDEASDKYIPTEDMITDEIKQEVELIKVLAKVKRIDTTKGFVYSKVSKTVNGYSYKFPVINIDSDDVKKMNSEIEKKYGFPENISSSNYYNYVGLETEEISYSYEIKNNILSLVVWMGGNESIWADTYNVDLNTSSKISSEALLEKYGFDKNNIIEKSTDAVTNYFEDMINKEKKMNMWETQYGEKYVKEWKAEIKPYIEKLKLFVNENNELCILGEFTHGGGQWSCTQTVVVNISKEFKVTELEFDKGPITHYIIDTYIPTQPELEEDEKKEEKEENKEEPVKQNNTSFSGTTTVSEGTYNRNKGNSGNIKIKNSKKGQFDFDIYCEYMLPAGYPNMGTLQGTAKEVSKGVFEYSESKAQNNIQDYKITFKVSNGKIVIEESEPYWSAGHNVTFSGTFEK